MTLNSLIALLTLLAAVYAIIPRAFRLDLRFRIKFTDWLIIAFGLGATHGLLFYEYFLSINVAPVWPWSDLGLGPGDVAYVLVFLFSCVLIFRISTARLAPSMIEDFLELVEELARSGRYPSLIKLIERNLQQIVRISNRDSRIARLHAWLKLRGASEDELRRWPQFHATVNEMLRQQDEEENEALQKTDGRPHPNLKKLKDLADRGISAASHFGYHIVPSHEDEAKAAKNIYREVILTESFADAVIALKPSFCIELFRTDLFSKELVHLFLRQMVRQPSSLLYSELRSNLNMTGMHRYELREENQMLVYLLEDASVAEEKSVWYPIGDATLKLLDELHLSQSEDPNNYPATVFSDEGKWDSPLFVSVQFFDVMIREALFQGIEWHMWLYYYNDFVQRMVRNHVFHEDICDPYAEWPNKYSYLIYQIISNLTDWIEAVQDIPTDQANIQLGDDPSRHRNDSIAKSSIFALSMCFPTIILANELPDSYRQYISGIVFRHYFTLKSNPETEPYADTLLATLAGEFVYGASEKEEYKSEVLSRFDRFDTLHYSRSNVDAFERAFQ